MNSEKRWNIDISLLLLPAIAFFLLVFIFPFLYGLYMSLTTKDGIFTFANYIKFFTDNWEYRTIWITLKIAMPVTIVSTALAIPLAYYMKNGIRNEKLVTFFLVLPTTLGMVLVAEGMLTFMGPNGWINQFLMAIHIIKEPIRMTHNYIGVVISLFLQNFPFGFLLLLGYISGIDPTLEKAATMLGASKMHTFWKVMFPLMSPGVTIAFSLNFAASFSVFPSVVMLGQPSGPTRAIAYAAYQWSYEKYNQNFGSTICIIMIVIQTLVVLTVLFWRQRMYRGASMVGKG
jgi:putative spermidine/putrescine transport system permease protein